MRKLSIYYTLNMFLLPIIGVTGACAQVQTKSNNESQKIEFSERRILEAEVQYPEAQTLSLKAVVSNDNRDGIDIHYIGYESGKFVFDFSTNTMDHNEVVPEYYFYFDNKEPILARASKLELELPEGDHILAACLLDQQGFTIKRNGASLSRMIRIKDGEIIKIAEGGTLMFYNQPRKVYKANEPVHLDFCIPLAPLDESFELFAIIDGQEFQIDTDKTYLVEGLKPGLHMAELQLFRFGQLYNAPLNPARMTFKID